MTTSPASVRTILEHRRDESRAAQNRRRIIHRRWTLVLRIEPDEGRVADQILQLDTLSDSITTTAAEQLAERCRGGTGSSPSAA